MSQAQLIDAYAAGATRPADALAGLSEADLDARPGPGRWSIRELVVHLADSDLIGGERMKRVIAMERPKLLAYDDNAFVAKLDYAAQDPSLCAELFRLQRLQTAAILRRLPDEAFARVGEHSEDGPLSLADLVGKYTRHLAHHLTFLDGKRAALGK